MMTQKSMKHSKIRIGGKYVPLRMCVACREIRPQAELIRVVKQSDGKIAVDLKHKLGGRGAYVCKAEECITKAQKIRGLERGLKSAVPQEIYEECLNVE